MFPDKMFIPKKKYTSIYQKMETIRYICKINGISDEVDWIINEVKKEIRKTRKMLNNKEKYDIIYIRR